MRGVRPRGQRIDAKGRNAFARSVGLCLVALGALCAAPRDALAGDDDPPARAAADPSAIDRCVAVLRDSKDPVARFDAVRRLGAIASPSVPPRLAIVATEDPDPGLRAEAANQLAKHPDASATQSLLQLAADGGTREVRIALARGVVEREITVGTILVAAAERGLDANSRDRLVELLGTSKDPIAVGRLELIARDPRDPSRETAMRTLAAIPAGKLILPPLIGEIVATSSDADLVATALELAGPECDDDVTAASLRLRKVGEPAIDAALVDRTVRRAAATHSSPESMSTAGARDVRPRTDRVHVFTQTSETEAVWARIRQDFIDHPPEMEDLRIEVLSHNEPLGARRTCAYRGLQFTRSLRVLDDWFKGLRGVTTDPRGFGAAESLHRAYARVGWRPGAAREIVLYCEEVPRDIERAMADAAAHLAADGTKLRVLYLTRNERAEIPEKLVRLAKAGGGAAVLAPLPQVHKLR